MGKRKKASNRALSSGRRRNTTPSYASSAKLRPGKKPWLSTWGVLIVSVIMVIVLGASVLTFLGQ